MVTIRDVAKAAGVSQATVSFSLHHDPRIPERTAERVRETARRLGYAVNLSARQLRSGKSGVIGIDIFELGQPQPSQMAAAFTDEAQRRGVQAIVQQTSNRIENELSNLQNVTNKLCDGTFFSPGSVTNEQIAREAGGKAIVLLNDYSDEPMFDSVYTPCIEGSEAAVRHLMAVGCRSIALLGCDWKPYDEALRGGATRYRRLAGSMRALSAAGRQLPDYMTIPCEWTLDDAYRATVRFVESGAAFDGLYCMTDTMAMGAIRALADHGVRVPQDVMLVGFDGIAEAAYCTPSISTVAVDLDDLARKAVSLLLERINHPDLDRPPERLTAGWRLIQRETTLR